MIIKDYSDWTKAVSIIKRGCVLAFDTETTGLNTRKDRVIGIGVSNEFLDSFYLPILSWDGEKLVETPMASYALKLVQALQGQCLIAHNSYFDLEMIKNNFGVDLWNDLYADTIMLKHTVSEEQPFGLKQIAKILWGVSELEEQQAMKESIKANGGTVSEFYKADTDLMGLYCAKDCELTIKVFKYYSRILNSEGLESFFFDEEVMPLYKKVTRVMQSRGVPVDVSLLEKTLKEINIDISEIEAKIQEAIKPLIPEFEPYYLDKNYPASRSGEFAQGVVEYVGLDLPRTASGKFSITKKTLAPFNCKFSNFLKGDGLLDIKGIRDIQRLLLNRSGVKYPFNLSSKHHLKRLFFEKGLKEEPLNTTDKGNPQVDDDFLTLMANKYDWVKDLQIYNKLIKIRGTYIERFLNEQEDGIFYPEFKQHGTISGRYGSDLQQLSRPFEESQRDSVDSRVFKYTNIIRHFFLSGDGFKFIDNDYESLEPHVFAHVSGDEGLKDIFRHGHDFYSTIAILTEGLKDVSADKKADNYLGKVNKTGRQKAKAYSLGIPYGMSSYALAKSINVSEEEAQILFNGYFKGFPELKKWYDSSAEFVKKNGYIKSQAGRVRHLKDAKKLYDAYGDKLLDTLYLWKEFHGTDRYTEMKELRNRFKNAINNARNFQIQSLSASIVNRAAIAIQEWLDANKIDGYVCAQIHDQLVIRVEDSRAEEVRLKVQELMENTYKLSIELKAPAQIATNFADGH